MGPTPDVQGLMQRTKRYWYEDGFADLGLGAFLLVIGLLFGAQALTPPGSPLWLIWSFGWPVVLIGGGFVINHVVTQLKATYTYPRTGYVTYERQGRSRVAQLITVFLVAAGLAVSMVALSRGLLSLTLLYGLAFTAAFGFVGYRVALPRYLLLAVWSLVVGLALSPFALTLEQGGGLFFTAVGLALLLAGTLAWHNYSRRAAA